MRFKLPVSWIALFIIGFFLSLFLGLVSGVPLGVSFFRAATVALFLGIPAAASQFIFKKYLAEAIDLSELTGSYQSEGEELLSDLHSSEEQTTTEPAPHLEDLDHPASGIWETPADKDLTFAQVNHEMNWKGESDGLKKTTRDSFAEEDPAIMAETIRNVIIKEDVVKAASGKDEKHD